VAAADKIVRYKKYPTETYYVYGRDNTKQMLQDMLAFFDEYLKESPGRWERTGGQAVGRSPAPLYRLTREAPGTVIGHSPCSLWARPRVRFPSPGTLEMFWHPPLVPVPTVETIHVERPETGSEIAGHDHSVRVPYVHTPTPLKMLFPTSGGFVPRSSPWEQRSAVGCRSSPRCRGWSGSHHVDHREPVFEGTDEDVGASGSRGLLRRELPVP